MRLERGAPADSPASAVARLFIQKDFREAETTTGKIPRIIVAHECHPFFTDFGEKDFPSELREQLWVRLRTLALILILILILAGL